MENYKLEQVSKLQYTKTSILFRKLISKSLTSAFEKTLPCAIQLLVEKNNSESKEKELVNYKSHELEFPTGPKIFASNHVFYDDIATLCVVINENVHILVDTGSKKDFKSLIDCIALYLNGVIYVDKASPEDRALSALKMEKVLSNGGNILMFPESTWNFSQNEIIRPFRAGIIDLARKSESSIIPCGIDAINNKYVVNFGKPLQMDTESKLELYRDLRDALSTLRYEIWEKDLEKFESLDESFWLEYIKNICRDGDYDLVYEENNVFKPKNVVSLEQIICEIFGLEYHTMATNYEEYKKIKRLVQGWTNYK